MSNLSLPTLSVARVANEFLAGRLTKPVSPVVEEKTSLAQSRDAGASVFLDSCGRSGGGGSSGDGGSRGGGCSGGGLDILLAEAVLAGVVVAEAAAGSRPPEISVA